MNPNVEPRKCACSPDCPKRLKPHSRWRYYRGHKPKASVSVAPAPDWAEGKRRTLDYTLTLAAARREMALLDKEIELLDDRLEAMRKERDEALAAKDVITERHGVVSKAAEYLEALVRGTVPEKK